MSKKIFLLIVALMSISLIGIISVQIYWVKDALENKQQQFKNNVTIALGRSSEKIKEKELSIVKRQYQNFFSDNKLRKDADIKTFLFQQIDTTNQQKLTYGTTILEENFKIPTDFIGNDSIVIKRFTGKEDIYFKQIYKSKNKDFGKPIEDEKKFSTFHVYSKLEEQQFENFVKQTKKFTPIHKRLRNQDLKNILEEELLKRNITQDFKYAVYENNYATPLKSGYFNNQVKDIFYYPLFEDDNGNSNYKLYIKFPNERVSMFEGMTSILLLSLLFTGIIIAAFSTSLYQLFRQKKISEIKTDFINNMTHEFKTPIATINLALDAIKNPKIIADQDKIMRYVNMIRDENKRMHGQVENVLRISKLDKNQLEINKVSVDMINIIELGIEHIQLLVDSKNGNINTHFNVLSTKVLGNQFHLTNVVVNILENAVKYSSNDPKIDVYAENTNKFFILKIEDKGIGMSRNAQKYIFNKFYREHSGNIHNVKGHGLGLAYVKEIIQNHQGTIHVESEKSKGSIFTVKLPLI